MNNCLFYAIKKFMMTKELFSKIENEELTKLQFKKKSDSRTTNEFFMKMKF